MARTINRVELLGRVGVEPEMRYTQSGTAVTKLRLATDRRRQNGDSETDWHNVTCWGKVGEVVNEHVSKGDRVFVTGRLSYSSYENSDGQRRFRTEIHANEVIFLDSRNGNGNGAEVEQAESEDSPF